jgi:hypothetical protein
MLPGRRRPRSGRLRYGLLGLVATLGVVAALAVSAAPASTQTSQRARLAVGVQVLRFQAAGRTLQAVSRVTATVTDLTGQRTTVHSRVLFSAVSGHDCKILTLVLNKLHLSLLGLNVDLSKVVLQITGIPSGQAGGGVLGSLFCSLASTRLGHAQRIAAARELTTRLQRRGDRVMHFTAYLTPKATTAQAGATCPVLDLVLGPLHLDLLGLVVDLNQVHLTVTATQGGGILGNLFCSLSTATATVPTVP